jgi:hypothetical protein
MRELDRFITAITLPIDGSIAEFEEKLAYLSPVEIGQ